MSQHPENPENAQADTELAPGDVTDFVVVLAGHDKGRTQVELSKALAECVEAAFSTGKKDGTVTLKVKVEPQESGVVRLVMDVVSKPSKEPAGSIYYADGEGHLSRDNAGLFYAQ